MLKLLLGKGLIHGDCMTVTGKTLAQNLAELPTLKDGQEVWPSFFAARKFVCLFANWLNS